MNTSYVGQPVSRVDGPAKVTGSAKYAGEYFASDLAYGVLVGSAVAAGRIASIDSERALKVPGVLHVFTHRNRPGTALLSRSWRDDVAPPGAPFRPLRDADIHFSGQPIALVVAEDFETARYASTLVEVRYEAAEHETDLEARLDEAYVPSTKRAGIDPPPDQRGDPLAALTRADAQVQQKYRTPIEHHNPMEPHAATAVCEANGTLTIYDKTQGVQNVQKFLTSVFGLKASDIRVMSPFVGGAFGSALRPNYPAFFAALAAHELKRSVRVTMTRQQMFTAGHRAAVVQTLSLAARKDGALEAVIHEAISNTSRFEDYQENIVNWSGLFYACGNVRLDYKLTQLDLPSPCDMRAPGATQGVFALETAMDELAYALNMDPLALRLRNYAETDQMAGKPFTSKALRACYTAGSQRFGWEKRSSEPRSMRDGHELIGWGMATGAWEALHMPTAARAVLTKGPKLEIANAASDLGTGTYTIMAQLAAEAMGLPLDAVTVKLGDSASATAPVSGGSWTAASTGAAVRAACESLQKQLAKFARGLDGSPLANADLEHVAFADGAIHLRADPARSVSFDDALRAGGVEQVEAEETVGPNQVSHAKASRNAHSAIFAEVRVDEELGVVRVMRVVNAVAAGRILNTKTAASQILGGVVWGIGMALHEETVLDHKLGRIVNHNLGEYHIPAHADVHDIDVIFVDEHDPEVTPLGVKGVGEIGIVGTAAAIGNAIYHATGRRIRDLPITIDKLL